MNNLRSLLRYWNWQVVYVPLFLIGILCAMSPAQ
jgi:hypothetical protein